MYSNHLLNLFYKIFVFIWMNGCRFVYYWSGTEGSILLHVHTKPKHRRIHTAAAQDYNGTLGSERVCNHSRHETMARRWPRFHTLYISPPGGALPGRSEPTVDTLSVPPIAPSWFYFMAGGGSVLFLVVAVVMAIGCRRLTARRSRPTMAYYSPHGAYHPNGATPRSGGGSKLTVWVEKGDGNSYWWGAEDGNSKNWRLF